MTPTDALKFLSHRGGAIEFSREGCRSQRELAVRIVVGHHRHFFTLCPDAFTDHGWEVIAEQVRVLSLRAEREDRELADIAADARVRRRRRGNW